MSLRDKLVAVCDAVRAKAGTTQKYKLADLPDAIKSIKSGGSGDSGDSGGTTIEEISKAERIKNLVQDDGDLLKGDVVLPDTVTEIRSHGIDNFDDLKSLVGPKVTSVGPNGINGCIHLKSISLPLCTHLQAGAISSCHNITAVDLPALKSLKGTDEPFSNNSISDLNLSACVEISGGRTIYDSIFGYESNDIRKIHLPVCTSIGRHAFSRLGSYESAGQRTHDIYLSGSTVCTIDVDAFGDDCHNITVYVPKNLLAEYQKQEWVGKYGDNVKLAAIPDEKKEA